ncbi:MAG: hypothetical protein AB1646_19470 [Thermodesulfobacteriota bacterium]
MDKYDLFLQDIMEKTQDESLAWENVSPGRYSDYIFQSDSAYRAFACEYMANERKYWLVFIDKKVPSHLDNWGTVVDEEHVCELIVLQEGRLLIALDEDYVDAEDLLQLSLLIEEKSAQTKELFAQFDLPPSEAPDLSDKKTGIPGG